MSSDIVITAENLSKAYHVYKKPGDRILQMFAGNSRQLYDEFWALRDISFEVRKGETIGVLGRNGSGKSTLLQIVAGTLAPTSGSISVNGRLNALLELGAGFNPEFTGRENAFLNATIFGLSQAQIELKFDEIAAFADIGNFLEQPVKTYSSGMYARLAFAVAMAMEPEILIIDEILSVGDVFFQAKCVQKLDRFRENGGTVFFVTHDTYSVERICTKTLVLNQGRKIYEGATNDGVTIYYKCSRETETQQARTDDTALPQPQEAPLPSMGTPIMARRDHVVTDGSATIEEIFVSDENYADKRSFQTGEWMVVRLVVKFNVDFDSVDFGVGLRDTAGTLIGGAHSMYNHRPLRNVRAHERRVLVARIKLDVEPREYLLLAGIASHLSPQAYQECCGLYDFYSINVFGRRLAWGQVALPNETFEQTGQTAGTPLSGNPDTDTGQQSCS